MKVGKGRPFRLPAKSRAQAVNRYKGFLQKSLSCVSHAVWHTAEAQRGGKGEFVLLTREAPLSLHCPDREPIYLTATQNFHLEKDHRFTGEWKVKTDRYEYTVSFSETLEPELLAWHWHPGSKVDKPHLHARLGGSLAKAHLPTGRVSFEEVLLCLIHDLGVKPVREDWVGVLGETEARFAEYRTWR